MIGDNNDNNEIAKEKDSKASLLSEGVKIFGLHKIEKVAVDSTVSHFLLMFGYKLFSAYFPLYLLEQGLSNQKVGYTYLLIYLPIALFSPIVGGLLHRISPRVLSSLGIFGYGLYSLGLLFAPHEFFYPLQVMLGISAALFFVSSRVSIMRAKLPNYDSAFGWFYSAPIYSEILATAAGVLLISFFGFSGVFIASFGIHILNVLLSSSVLGASTYKIEGRVAVRDIIKRYWAIFRARGDAVPYVAFSFLILLVGSFFDAFYLIFLKSLGWARSDILLYGFLLAIFNGALSLLAIRALRRGAGEKNIVRGGWLYGLGSVLLGILTPILNLPGVIAASVFKSFGGLTAGSARSGMLARAYPQEREETAAIDTIFGPLATAIGSFLGGFIAAFYGYQALFVGGGIAVLVGALIIGFISRKEIILPVHEKGV